jgi:hypothetical protein
MEDDIFQQFLKPVIGKVSMWLFNTMVIDSSAVRYYTGKARNMGDIDLLIWTEEPDVVIARILSELNCEVILGTEGGFYRAKYYPSCADPVMQAYPFLIDFHINAIYMDSVPILHVELDAFSLVHWAPVKSISGNTSVRLPLPHVDTLFNIKSRKLIGNDDIDILALCLAKKLTPPLFLNTRQTKNLEMMLDKLDATYERYCYYYYQEHDPFERNLCREMLSSLICDLK